MSLGEAESNAVLCIAQGHAQSAASAVMEMKEVKDCIYNSFVNHLSEECCTLCERKDSTVSLFRSIPVTALANSKWEDFIEELQSKAPLLLQAFTSVVSVYDHRNTVKVGSVHYRGICAAIAVLLKERSREMCGLQSLVSVLMYSVHCEKQVNMFSSSSVFILL